MGKKRKKQSQKQKQSQSQSQKISKATSPSGSGSSINTKNPLYYWDGMAFPQELQEKYKKVLDQLKEGQYQGLHLEKLHAHNGDGRDYWSVRTDQKGRLILTTEFIEGKRVLVFVRALPNHDYDKWERSLSAVPKPSAIHDQQKEQHLNAEDAQFKDMLQAVDTTQVTALKSHLGKYILLSPPQNGIVEIDGPCIVNGVAGSGKTSSALFLASRWREKNPYGEVICIASSAAVVKGMKDEFEAAQAATSQEEEKGKEEAKGKEAEKGKEEEKIVRFKTYSEWLCTDGGHKKLKSRKVISEEFEKWWKTYSQSYKEKDKYRSREKFRESSHSSSSSSLSFFPDAGVPERLFLNMDVTQLYQEFRKISTEEDYVKKGMGSFIAQGVDQQALRAIIYAAYEACPEEIKEESEDFASLQEQSRDEQTTTLVLVDEAQDLSKKQIENLIQWAAARGLRIVFFRDSLQTVRDASSNYLIIKDCFVQTLKDPSLRQQEIKEINLPVSYRSFPAAKPWVDGWLDIRKKLTEKMDKTEVIQLEVKVNEHSAPGSVHWITDIDSKKQALFDAGCKNPSFVVVAPKEYLEEAKRKFNTQLVLTPEEIKGRQFKVVLVYRPFSPDIFKDASKMLEQDRTKHFIRKQNNNNGLITSCNEVFVSLTRADSQMIIYQPAEHGFSTLVNNLTKDKVVDVNEDFSLILEKSDASEEKWLQEAKMQLRYGYIEKAEEIIKYHVKSEELKKEFAAFKIPSVEAEEKPSGSIPKQEELKREKEKEKEETKTARYANGLSDREAAYRIYTEVKEKGKTFLPQLIALAEGGNIYAQYNVYCFYNESLLEERYSGEAANFCFRAADGGHLEAQSRIATEYFMFATNLRGELSKKLDDEKQYCEQDILKYEKEAHEMCLKAAESGDPSAQHLLYRMYSEGRGVSIDRKAAFDWCLKSANQKFLPAMYNLARLYYKGGDGREKDLTKAEDWCVKALTINKGHTQTVFLFSCIREKLEEKIIPPQDSLSPECYREAQEGEPEALYEMAMNYFLRGAKMKESQVLMNTGFMYKEEAYKLCLQSAQSNNPRAQHLLYTMYSEGRGAPIDREVAFYWCLKSANQGCLEAMYDLALCYYEGDGTEKDLEKAEFWSQEAMMKGYKKAPLLLLSIQSDKKTLEQEHENTPRLFSCIKKETLRPITQSILSPAENSICAQTINYNPSFLSGNVSHFEKEVKYACDPNLALRQAAARGDIEKIRMLIHSGQITDINQKGPASGKTALHQAVLGKAKEALKVLLMLGADPAILDKDGKSALGLAQEQGNLELYKLLEGGSGIARRVGF